MVNSVRNESANLVIPVGDFSQVESRYEDLKEMDEKLPFCKIKREVVSPVAQSC